MSNDIISSVFAELTSDEVDWLNWWIMRSFLRSYETLDGGDGKVMFGAKYCVKELV